jgi:hypothetical protein
MAPCTSYSTTSANLVAPISKPMKRQPTNVVNNISDGEYSNPVRVVAFNTAEGWSRDVTEDIARALLDREAREADLSESARTFVQRVLDIVVH